jgi:hypothetical protein
MGMVFLLCIHYLFMLLGGLYFIAGLFKFNEYFGAAGVFGLLMLGSLKCMEWYDGHLTEKKNAERAKLG